MKTVNLETMKTVLQEMRGAADYIECRAILAETITNDSIILAECFNLIPAVLELIYSPDDKGRGGKIGEVCERLIRWQEAGRTWARWAEMHARKSGKSDIGKRQEEMKTGAGDWLYSCQNSTMETIVNEFWRRDSIILWDTEYFRIRCTWHELFDYLAGYNDKSVYGWFRPQVKENIMLSKYVVLLKEWKNSNKKIEYLQACPYCE